MSLWKRQFGFSNSSEFVKKKLTSSLNWKLKQFKSIEFIVWYVFFLISDSIAGATTNDTFSIEPPEGYLEAHITHITDSKTLLKVFFTAKYVLVFSVLETNFSL